MEELEKQVQVIKLVQAIEASAETCRLLAERIKDIENRQDTIWKCLQGMTEYLSKPEVKDEVR